MRLLVLAAGQGKRLNSDAAMLPKVMRTVLGKPLMAYVLDAADFIPADEVYGVVGYLKEAVMDAFPQINFVVQDERKGTGHAVMCAADAFKDYKGEVMVINGDMPLFKRSTLIDMWNSHKASGAVCTLGTFVAEGEIPPFGRIIRDDDGFVCDIVEQKDATEEQRAIRELNVGVYIFDSESLFAALPKLTKSPVSGEYYLTDVPRQLAKEGKKTAAYVLSDPDETLGVNTEADLAAVEALLKSKI
ncbi:MAG: NTP transferase domain-containing protein [Clostridia bacterium]|nr:NTP transferase domain-containing protein [Clostridia bacterium]